MNKFSLLISIVLFLPLTGAFSQAIDPALLEKAKAAGITQDQINSFIRKQQQAAVSGTNISPVPGNNQIVRERTALPTVSPYDSLLISSLLLNQQRVFGREIFSTQNLNFAPDYNLPTPEGYILAAGDEVIIDVWGASEMNVAQKISPEGFINIQGVGLVNLSGLTINETELKIKAALKRIMAGIGEKTHVKVSLGQIRSIKVNIVGEVMMPGTYTLPSLATLFNALYSAGGVNEIGSLRSIKVFRNNAEVADLDVYDFLLNGNYNTNIRLQDNDMIIIPPYENFVTVSGKIKRERTYELRNDETLEKLLEYAGGVSGDAYTENILVRRRSDRMYHIFSVTGTQATNFLMHDGDSVYVKPIIAQYSNRLILKGAVWQPGEYELCPASDSLSELITIAEGLIGNEFATRGQITRRKPDFTLEVIAFNTRDIVNGKTDLALKPNDEIYIPTIFDLREEYYIIVKGEVNRPDTVYFADNMTVEDAIMLCGGIKESASIEKVEVARRIQNQSGYSPITAEIFNFNISKSLENTPEVAAFVLQPFDEIIVRPSPGYKVQSSVYIDGEVLYTGEYVLASNGDRLSDLVKKAGGLTPAAYIKGANLKRRFTEEEKQKLESVLRITGDSISADSLKSMTINDYYSVGINLESAIRQPGGPDDVILVAGDQLYVPKYMGMVKVSGAVLYPNAVTYKAGKGLRSYVFNSGGYQNAARRRPYVVYMNGNVESTKSYFGIKHFPKIEPGSEVIVPMRIVRQGSSRMPEIMAIATTSVSLASVFAMLMGVLK